jgi:hypothetical protein
MGQIGVDMSDYEPTLETKPSNARYEAKVRVTPEGKSRLVPGSSVNTAFEEVEVAWYDGSIKVTIPGAAPAVIKQAYLTGAGRDVIVEISVSADAD